MAHARLRAASALLPTPGKYRAPQRASIVAVLCAAAFAAVAGPVDFGVADYNAALASRNLKWKVKYDVTLDPPETFHIEPYAYGGAHVSGGDLRGLMYGLLEAADQIRSTGRIKPTRGAPATAIRALRRFARDDISDWNRYFATLARDRFNRFTLIYTDPPANFDETVEKLRAISQTAAEYAVDFTLGLWYEPDPSLAKIIAACPMLRSIEIRTPAHDLEDYRTFVFKPLLDAGHRVALDPDPELAEAARAAGVALRNDPHSWPPNFEIEAPAGFEAHAELYWLWGRLGYDPKSNPVRAENPDEFRLAGRLIADLAAAKAPPNDWIASAAEVLNNRANNLASAKRSPLDLASALSTGGALLAASTLPDFQLLAQLASAEASKLRAVADTAGLSSAQSHAPLPRPQFTHTAIHTSTPDQPINLTLQIAPVNDARTVRLHYRAINSPSTSILEKPAAPSVAFVIPPAASDLLYYFEILDRQNGGWFEPDPMLATPYHIIRIEPKQP